MLLLALLGCQPEEPASTHETLPLAEEIAAAGIGRWPDGDWSFDWIPTVWAYGLHRLHEATGDDAWQDPYRAWLVDHNGPYAAEPPLGFQGSDSMSPAILASVLLHEDPEAGVDPIVAAGHRWIDDAPRTDEGAIEHWGENAAFGVPGQVWVDSQFMVGVFMTSEVWRGDLDGLDAFEEQYGVFSDLLRDPTTDLYRHAYDDATDANIPVEPTFWARGNSWVLVSASEALWVDAGRVDLRREFTDHARAVAALQADDGLWHTVLEGHDDDPANYTETSASALITYAFVKGVREGVLDMDEFLPVIDDAIDGLRERVEYEDGVPVVEGTSYGTVPGDYEYYVGIGRREDLMLGVGAMVMVLAEADGLPRESP